MTEKLSMAQPREARRITISLTPPALFGGIAGLCAGFVLIFSLGIFLGRGHNLEERIPTLERVLPEKSASQPPHIIAGDEDIGIDRVEYPVPDPAAAEGTEGRPAGVISQGELGYRSNLKPNSRPAKPGATAASTPSGNMAPASPQSPAPPQAPAAPPRAPAGTQASTPPSQSSASSGAAQPVQGGAPDLRPLGPDSIQAPAPASPGSGKDTQVYQYVYQAAAYKAEAPCAAFADKLRKAGFKARVQTIEADGTTWYRTMIDFTGQPDDTDALRERLKTHGVPKVLLRSKTPVL